MSEFTRVNVTCPNCRQAGEAEIWTSINTADDPDAAQWLIDGFLLQHECPACGHVSQLNHDCLYHDAERNAYLLYMANTGKKQDALSALEKRAAEGAIVRLVRTHEELREKAAILRDGLDDRAVEVAKLAAFDKFAEEGQLPASARAYYGALAEDGGIIVEFVAPTGTQSTTIPRPVYQGIADSFTEAQPAQVDRAWATQILTNWN